MGSDVSPSHGANSTVAPPGSVVVELNDAQSPPNTQRTEGATDSDHSDVRRRPERRRSRWRAAAPVWGAALAAILALAGGFALGRTVTSPADSAAQASPPSPGVIVAQVEARQISATVVARADIAFANRIPVNPTAPDGATSAVVTGHVPTVGQTVRAGDVLLEVSGRPIVVLTGAFPTYRTLGPDCAGPDVVQLRAALAALGYAVGDPASPTYDKTLAKAVATLYTDRGYSAPGAGDATKAQAIKDAETALKQANDAVTAAQSALSQAEAIDPTDTTRADAIAQAQQDLTAAQQQVSPANDALTAARRAAWTPLPSTEVIFVPQTSERVDQVNVTLGQVLGAATTPGARSTSALVLADAAITVTASVSAVQAGVVRVGDPAVLGLGGGQTTATAYVTAIGACTGGDPTLPQCPVSLALEAEPALDPESAGGNVQVTITTSTSDAGSLVVPVAAVSANSTGQARVEVIDGPLLKDVPAAAQPTRWVTIEPGLSAEGYVEVRASTPALTKGDLVVVGVGAVASGPSPASPVASGTGATP